MNELVVALAVGGVGAFAAYWYIKFRFTLPLEARSRDLSRVFAGFTSFSREVLDHIYIPDSIEHYGDITSYYLMKLHKLFPDSSMLVFERSGGEWKLINYLKNFKTEPKLMTSYKWNVFDKAAGDTEIVRLENLAAGPEGGVAELFRIFDVKAAVLCPFMHSGAQAGRMLVFGGARRDFFDPAEPYLHFVVAQLNAVYKISEKLVFLKKENDQQKSELNAVVRELNTTGTRLIQRTRERKALYEVVTLGAGDEKDVKTGCGAIMSVVARMMEADVVACLLFDESKNELVVNPGSCGISDDQRMFYSLDVNNTASSSVRTFLTKKPFMTADAQNDPEVITHYAKLWNIRSLMIVPITLHARVIGVLRVGSRNRGVFTQDQLEFLSIIADELAILIEMVSLYENVSRTAKELAQLNTLKDEFLSTVSHELKTPLTTIKGFVSVILSGEVGPLNEQQLNFLEVVDQSVNRLTHLISNLLDLSRLNGKVEMEFAPVSVKELIKNSVSMMLLKAKEKNVILTSVADKAMPPVHADMRWMSQVVDNLIINAIKYAGPGAKVHVSGHNKGEAVVVCVEDNGPGIPADEQKLIFDKFYRCKASASQVPGTGLGLAISKSVVEKHGGKIWLESKPGAGARFCFALPIAKEKADGKA